jgi:hypothetical protein
MLLGARCVRTQPLERAANVVQPSSPSVAGVDGAAACRRALAALPDFGGGDEGDLLRDVAARIAARLATVTPRLAEITAKPARAESLVPSWRHLASTIAEHRIAADATPAQRLMDADLAVSVIECWTRAAEMDRALTAT